MQQRGFSLVELVAVIVVVAIIGAVAASRTFSQKTFELQAGRDLLISAFFMAQQTALHQNAGVRLTTQGTTVDIRQDRDGDGLYDPSESLSKGGAVYPVSLPGGVTVTAGSFDFDRLGHTQPASVQVQKGAVTLPVDVSATGYAR